MKKSSKNDAVLGPIQQFLLNPRYGKHDRSSPRERTGEEIENAEVLLKNIHLAFSGVNRRGGVSLHETYAVDLYGSQQERTELRKLDTDRSWPEVNSEWIEQFSGVGGMNFFNDVALRYYTPAYFCWYLERDHLSNSMVTETILFNFSWDEKQQFMPTTEDAKKLAMFTNDQARVIQHFLEHVMRFNEDEFFYVESIKNSLESFWKPLQKRA